MPRPNRDALHLAALRRYHAEHGTLPSYAQMSALLHFKAKNASFKLAQRLCKTGHLQQAPGGRLSPGEHFFELPLIDESVPAGVADPGEISGGADRQAIDRLLVDHPDQTVLVRVKGDSMMDAGVLDGDTAVVVKGVAARDGDYVVARIDGGYTLKELRTVDRKRVLVPHNETYKIMSAQSELEIVGVVKGIVRRLDRL